MSLDTIRLVGLILKFLLPYSFTALADIIKVAIHKRTYQEIPSAKNVIVVGGSFAGIEVAGRLANSLPTGYKVVLIERNSHFNYTFNFPRYTVLQGHEKLAFVPYDNLDKSWPKGSFQHLRGEVTAITKDTVTLKSGEDVSYAFLVIATGCTQPPPTKMQAIERDEACSQLSGYQKRIESADKIAVVGGGAVGIELVSDIKSYYPKKHVTLVHSREQLLPKFGPRLHRHVLKTVEDIGVEVLLNERPVMSNEAAGVDEKSPISTKSLRFNDGRVVEYDIVIPCTGQTPNSNIINSVAPDSISKSTGRILVRPTLQISGPKDTPNNLFAVGDVAEHGGPQMARASFFQAPVIAKNIISMIHGHKATTVYSPRPEIEGSLKLTLGKINTAMYCITSDGTEILLTSKKGKEDLEVDTAWWHLGADIRTARADIQT